MTIGGEFNINTNYIYFEDVKNRTINLISGFIDYLEMECNLNVILEECYEWYYFEYTEELMMLSDIFDEDLSTRIKDVVSALQKVSDNNYDLYSFDWEDIVNELYILRKDIDSQSSYTLPLESTEYIDYLKYSSYAENTSDSFENEYEEIQRLISETRMPKVAKWNMFARKYIGSNEYINLLDIVNYLKEQCHFIPGMLNLTRELDDVVLLYDKERLISIRSTGIDECVGQQIQELFIPILNESRYIAIRDLPCVSDLPPINVKWTEWLIYSVVQKYCANIVTFNSSNKLKYAIPFLTLKMNYDEEEATEFALDYASSNETEFVISDDLEDIDELISEFIEESIDDENEDIELEMDDWLESEFGDEFKDEFDDDLEIEGMNDDEENCDY